MAIGRAKLRLFGAIAIYKGKESPKMRTRIIGFNDFYLLKS
jgi:hypothetical protein